MAVKGLLALAKAAKNYGNPPLPGELPMDYYSRLARARDQGFDTDTPVYHGTASDFDAFDPDRAIGSQFWSTTDKAAIESGDVGAQGKGVIKEMYHRINNPAGWDEYDKFGIDELIGQGYDGLKLPDADGQSTMVAFDPTQYRSVNAAFDPAKKESSNLLAGGASVGLLGAGALATLAPQEAEAGAAGLLNKIRAYHGSPHDFDRFSTESIGTGEGAQQYGHGLYFAEREPTALSYRDALTPRDYEFENYLAMQNEMAENSGDYTRMEFLQQAMNHDTPQDFRNIASDSDYDDDYREMAADFADEMEAFRNESGEPVNFGRMYEVDIDARPEELLDFDAPLSEQSDQVKNMWDNWKASAAGKKVASEMPGNFEGDITGQEMHGLIYEGMSPSPEQQYGRGMAIKESIDATQYLRDQGLKGIKYADAQTRFSPKGRTSNYVIFDDATVDIARKYGVSMPVAAGLLSGGLGTEQAQAADVVQEQSFGDMVNEYANINQRAQAAEAQKFDALMREDARLRDMGSASFGQVSPELAAYRRSQILPTIGEMGMGALEGVVDTVDFLSQLPTAISTMTMPKRTPLRDRLGGLLDYSFVDERDQRARDEARLIGGLLSPI